jgi:hypothetical protein
MDGAVTYTFLARLTSIAGSAGTVLLLVHFLTPVEQGYYYTLLSLVSLQIVFELGFSFVVQQLAAHECAHLQLCEDGGVSGDDAAHARLAAALRLSVRWYSAAAAGMAAILAPLGWVFFLRNAAAPAGGAQIAWQGPWLAAVLASCVSLWCMPFYSFLEGCGYVREVAAMRFRQSAAAAVCAWIPFALGRGLFSPAAALAGFVGAGAWFVFRHRRLLAGLMQKASGANALDGDAVSWRHEVWPFQWRIAVSSTCTYFTVQALVPILFALRGPVEAGQMGMSLSVAGYMAVLALAWTSTKATPFGVLIARGEFVRLLALFRRALTQSMGAFGLAATAALAGVALLPFVAPRLAVRMLPVGLFALLIVGAAANHFTQNLAIVLRSFKQEPFLGQSLMAAGVNIAVALALIPRLGQMGAVLSYVLATGAAGLPIGLVIYRRSCRALVPACEANNQTIRIAIAARQGGGR